MLNKNPSGSPKWNQGAKDVLLAKMPEQLAAGYSQHRPDTIAKMLRSATVPV